jgi:hypothetical protein
LPKNRGSKLSVGHYSSMFEEQGFVQKLARIYRYRRPYPNKAAINTKRKAFIPSLISFSLALSVQKLKKNYISGLEKEKEEQHH